VVPVQWFLHINFNFILCLVQIRGMHLVLVLVIILIAYIIYSYIQSYNTMANELREIRLKCMQSGVKMVSPPTKEPMQVMSNDIISSLKSLQGMIAKKY